ncbi:MAG TPA: TIGR02147 family protein [Polyangiales bacterium]
MGSRAKVDVFAYRDYRAFLRAFSDRMRAEKTGFSAAEFAKRAGLKSPNFFKLVVDGQRNITQDVAHRFGDACGLHDDSLSYFCALVAFNQAKTSRERDLHYEKLQSFRRFRAAHRLDGAQSAYHAEWYIPAIYELAACRDFDPDPRAVAKSLLPAISPKQAQEGLAVLVELGLLVPDADGRLRPAQSIVETPEGPLGHHVVRYHRTMLERAAEALDHVPREEREIASLTIACSEERMRELKAELEAFRFKLAQRYQADSGAERVVQVNFQLFPLSKKKG